MTLHFKDGTQKTIEHKGITVKKEGDVKDHGI